MYKKTVLTATIGLVALLLTTNVNAQLYSSGNNLIGGNYVGIGDNEPKAKLHTSVDKWRDKFCGVNENDIPLIVTQRLNPKYSAPCTLSTWEQNTLFTVQNNGNVGVGTIRPPSKLHIDNGNLLITNGRLILQNSSGLGSGTNQVALNSDGIIECREVEVDLGVIPDYVFDENYELMPLEEVKAFIQKNKHLPNVKSEAEFKEDGSISLTEMNLTLLEKVEELTLYILDLQEQINELKKQ